MRRRPQVGELIPPEQGSHLGIRQQSNALKIYEFQKPRQGRLMLRQSGQFVAQK